MHKKEALLVLPSKVMFAGPVDAPVEITVFGDYESPETRQLNEVMKRK
jgi:protein-disulfide isomerase